MRKVENAYGIRTVGVGESLQPLCSILHCTHFGGPFQPSPMCFEQRGFLKTCGVTEPREVREVLRADLASSIARDLSDRQCFDFHPLASNQVHKGPVSTHRLLLHSHRCLGSFLLEPLHLRFTYRQCGLSCLQRHSSRCPRLAQRACAQVVECARMIAVPDLVVVYCAHERKHAHGTNSSLAGEPSSQAKADHRGAPSTD